MLAFLKVLTEVGKEAAKGTAEKIPDFKTSPEKVDIPPPPLGGPVRIPDFDPKKRPSSIEDAPLTRSAEMEAQRPLSLIERAQGFIPMTTEEIQKAFSISPFSKVVTEEIDSLKELKYYIENGYEEVTIGDKTVLVPKDLDLNLKDENGKTNLERMKEGKPPIGPDGKPYNLHHIGQNKDGPYALIPDSDHKSMYSDLHDNTKSSEIDRAKFQTEKKEIYKGLAEQMENSEEK